ncbi:MAG: hypothetical protein JO121_32475 [Deltaproteobacteria bacterium]|nr:hypothetical protein [Deltaproteobacteria bacterium]
MTCPKASRARARYQWPLALALVLFEDADLLAAVEPTLLEIVGPITPDLKVATAHRVLNLGFLETNQARKQAPRPLDITREPQYDRFAGGSRSWPAAKKALTTDG